MFARTVTIGIIVTIAAASQPASAGIYNTTDAVNETQLSQDFGKIFSGVLGDLRTISVEKPLREPPLRKRYMLMEALGRTGELNLKSLEQQLDYSAVLIRRGKADEAIQLLLPLTRENSSNFIVWSHFATAHYLSSNEDFRLKAGAYMKEALRAWPERWVELEDDQKHFLEKFGWEQGTFDQNRKYEVYFAKLLKHRNDQARKKLASDELDPLFTDAKGNPVRFVNTEGKFEVGRIAAGEKAKLPGDAIEIVEQLLVWMPNDLKLYQLLGEVFNAHAMEYKDQGDKERDIRAAYQIMHELVSGFKEARGGERNVPGDLVERLNALASNVSKMQKTMPKGLKDIVDRPPGDDNEKTPMDERTLRTLVVGFITGFAVGLFALWQFQEMRRRKQARAASNT